MKTLSIIVAIAQNNAIGKDNQLLWHLSEDLKRFKKLTTGKTVIMGKKTYESLPFRPLPNRKNIVLSDNNADVIPGCIMANSIPQAIELADDGENFIMGGGSIYKQFLPVANRLYLTIVYHDFEADTFFPEINFNEWKTLEESEIFTDEANGLSYKYITYERA
jgi:dihydrofolate reductase